MIFTQRKVFYSLFALLLPVLIAMSVACQGDVYVASGCETCPNLCVAKENESTGRCVACLKDADCQDSTSPTKKCTSDYRCICGSDKDCPERQYCKGTKGCVDCLNDQQCAAQSPERPYCVNDRCEICVRDQERACSPDGQVVCKQGRQICGVNGLWGICEGAVVCKSNERCDKDVCVLDCPADSCKEGTKICVGAASDVPGRYKSCGIDAKGCGAWGAEKTCAPSEVCSNGQCNPYNCPPAPCQQGEARCLNASQSQTCEKDVYGCWKWGQATNCPQETACIAAVGRCTKCVPNEQQDCYAGSLSTRNVGICRVGKKSCKADGSGFSECIGEVLPATERCNGLDDDCDGVVDNGFVGVGTDCVVGVGTCEAKGKIRCKTDGTGTECSAQSGSPNTELCNGLDDNCDGKIDETFPLLGQGCTLGQGDCRGTGTWICATDKMNLLCNAQTTSPKTEVCDNQDNDCDGKIDEQLTRSCYTATSGAPGVGECRSGVQICNAGVWGICSGEAPPQQEICDGKDNDCDGQIDQGLTKACYTGPTGTQNVGECKAGSQICNVGVWGTCNGEMTPQQDTCGDGKDNDCNGQIDDGAGCCSPGRVLSLNGASYVEIPVSKGTFQLRNALTVEAWAYVTAVPPSPGNSRVFSKGATGSTYEDYNLAFCTNACQSSPKPGGTLKDAGGRNVDFTANNGVAFSTWVHTALTYDGSTGRLYINGVLTKTLSVTGPLTATSNHKVYLGRSGGAPDNFTGLIDEVRVWNMARSQAEIAASMRKRLVGNEVGLVGYWNFDANNANDLTSQQNHGVLSGAASIVTATNQAWCTTP